MGPTDPTSAEAVIDSPDRHRTIQIAAVIAILIATFVGGQAVGAARPDPIRGRVANPIVVRGCAIRMAAKPYMLENTAHSCTGFKKVFYYKGWLQVISDSSLPVVSVAVTTDESLVAKGIIAGASGGGSTTKIRFYSTRKERTVPASAKILQCDKCNVWVTIMSFGPEPEPHPSGSSQSPSG